MSNINSTQTDLHFAMAGDENFDDADAPDVSLEEARLSARPHLRRRVSQSQRVWKRQRRVEEPSDPNRYVKWTAYDRPAEFPTAVQALVTGEAGRTRGTQHLRRGKWRRRRGASRE